MWRGRPWVHCFHWWRGGQRSMLTSPTRAEWLKTASNTWEIPERERMKKKLKLNAKSSIKQMIERVLGVLVSSLKYYKCSTTVWVLKFIPGIYTAPWKRIWALPDFFIFCIFVTLNWFRYANKINKTPRVNIITVFKRSFLLLMEKCWPGVRNLLPP